MPIITIIDTSFGTLNLGDEVIMDEVNSHLYQMFPNARIFRIASHNYMWRPAYYCLRRSDFCFVGGTNILASKGWLIRWFEALLPFMKVHCLGVTWGGHRATPTFRDRLLLRCVMATNKVHSVRDGYAKCLLDKMGIQSVNTSCPSMWKLTPEHCSAIPKVKSRDVLFTLTSYKSDPAADRAMIDTLRRHYRTLYYFPQMHLDGEYPRQLGVDCIRVVPPNMQAYNQILANEEVDYVGNRLHGGVRALQFKKRSLIIGIDHRSVEISRDTGLPVLPRNKLHKMEDWITGSASTEIRLPVEAIARWKSQFTGNGDRNPNLPRLQYCHTYVES